MPEGSGALKGKVRDGAGVRRKVIASAGRPGKGCMVPLKDVMAPYAHVRLIKGGRGADAEVG